MFFRIVNKIKNFDPILKISAILMLISFFWTSPKNNILDAVDWKVIGILFCLMLVIENLKEANLFDRASEFILNRLNDSRSLGIMLVLCCFVSSMFITNDVALITFVPLTLLLLKGIESKNLLMDIIILETISANLGSQFTPIGNPQNLYLYSHFNLNLNVFIRHMLAPTIISFILLLACTFFLKKEKIKNHLKEKKHIDKKLSLIWGIAFIMCLLSVVRIIPYIYLTAILILLSLFTNLNALKKVDYGILFTFIFLFIFVANLLELKYIDTHVIPLIQKDLYLSGIVFSQFISNVPAAILLAPLSSDWKTIMYSVNVGGLGTLIASMASLISYKIYAVENSEDKKEFLHRFTVYNFFILIILGLIFYILLK